MAISKKSITILQKNAEKALRLAVQQVIRELNRAGQPVFIWKNGKVVKLTAKNLLRKKK